MDTISDESFSTDSPVFAFSSYLYTALRNGRWESSVLRAALSIDLKAFELLLFPIHIEKHWQLIAAFPKSYLLVFFGSMLNVSLAALGSILGLLEVIFSVNNGTFVRNEWMLLAPDNIPNQRDSSSCGVFACMNAYSLVCDERNPPYKSDNIDGIRHWMVHHLINTSSKKKYLKKQYHTIGPGLTPIKNVAVSILDVKRSVPGCDSSLNSFAAIKWLADQRLKSTPENVSNKEANSQSTKESERRSTTSINHNGTLDQGKLIKLHDLKLGHSKKRM